MNFFQSEILAVPLPKLAYKRVSYWHAIWWPKGAITLTETLRPGMPDCFQQEVPD